MDGGTLQGYALVITAAGSAIAAVISAFSLAQSKINSGKADQVLAVTTDTHHAVNGKMEEIKRLYQESTLQAVALEKARGETQAAEIRAQNVRTP